jgi:hypothetical protein
MPRLAEDDCPDAEGTASGSVQGALALYFACAAYNLVRMRNLTAPVPAV